MLIFVDIILGLINFDNYCYWVLAVTTLYLEGKLQGKQVMTSKVRPIDLTKNMAYMKIDIKRLINVEKKEKTNYRLLLWVENQPGKVAKYLTDQFFEEEPKTIKRSEEKFVQKRLIEESKKDPSQEKLMLEVDEEGFIHKNNSGYFKIHPQDRLRMQLVQLFQEDPSQLLISNYQSKEEDKKICFFELSRFYKIPRVYHELDIKLLSQKEVQEIKKQEGKKKQVKRSFGCQIQAQLLVVPEPIGILELFMIQANLTRDTELFGQMDPYVRIKIGDRIQNTSVCENSGKNPVWNIKLKIPIKSVNERLLVQIYDRDPTFDDLIGEKQINLFQERFLIPERNFISHPVYILYQEKPVGKLDLECRFTLYE